MDGEARWVNTDLRHPPPDADKTASWIATIRYGRIDLLWQLGQHHFGRDHQTGDQGDTAQRSALL